MASTLNQQIYDRLKLADREKPAGSIVLSASQRGIVEGMTQSLAGWIRRPEGAQALRLLRMYHREIVFCRTLRDLGAQNYILDGHGPATVSYFPDKKGPWTSMQNPSGALRCEVPWLELTERAFTHNAEIAKMTAADDLKEWVRREMTSIIDDVQRRSTPR